ncbi:MAG TPA: zinc-ribbon domain-containing protein [Candidatus Acidoferrales bacterium]|nr:zinc-ribbon domain-containing protein [Candidatus Acidoferrales bacterium]
MKCPKCGTEARDVARFCQRCHATLRYECPSCKHEQRQGGKCEKCGVDFLKYVTAVVAAKQGEADLIHDRIEQRSTLMKNVLLTPFTLGIPLIRSLIMGSRRSRTS